MNISWTFLDTYRRCPLRARLQFIEKVIPRDKVDHRPFIVGIVGDWLFTKWVERNFSEGWMQGKAKDIFDWWLKKVNVKYRSSDDYYKLLYKLQKSVEALEALSFELGLDKKKLITQKKILFKGGSFTFTGKIDIWLPEENAIWDLKITESLKYLKKGQLFFYKWLFVHSGIEAKNLAFLVPLRTKGLETVEYNKEDLAQFEKDLKKTLADVQQRKFNKNMEECWNCPVRNWCQEDMDLFESQRNKDGIFNIYIKRRK